MGSKNKVNPNKRPTTEANVRRAAKEATRRAVRLTRIITFSVLLDKHGLTPEDIVDIYHQTNDLSDSVIEGRVSLADLACVLREEYGIEM